MKRVCRVLGVARSNLIHKRFRSPQWQDGRRNRLTDDATLIEEIKQTIVHLPSYGYRRVWGRLRWERARHGAAPINAKRVYRVMRMHGLLLQRPSVIPRLERPHKGRVAVMQSNQRWCSDGFEFRCDNGQPLRVTFAMDCCDREIMSWAASTGGHCGDIVRDVMLAAIENRFGQTLCTPAPIEWLTDNGSAYTAYKTRALALEIGLNPLTTPICSPQSNGMAESFVKTIKRDYIAFMPKPDPQTAAQSLAIAFEHYNEQHPHSALKYQSPREFRRTTLS